MGEELDNIKDHLYRKEGYNLGPFGRLRTDYARNNLSFISDFLFNLYDKPATWLHDKVVVPNRKQSVYYHWNFPRVPTVDECYVDDFACIHEADQQFKRDRKVDRNIIKILRMRFDECLHVFNGPDAGAYDWCESMKKDAEEAGYNYMVKYGELKTDGQSNLNLMEARTRSSDVYLKQKHRYIWERRQAIKKEQEEKLAAQANE